MCDRLKKAADFGRSNYDMIGVPYVMGGEVEEEGPGVLMTPWEVAIIVIV